MRTLPLLILWLTATLCQAQKPNVWVGHTAAVTCMALSPDGKTLVTGSADKTLILWNVEKGEKIMSLFGHTAEIRSVMFWGNEKIISGGWDKQALIWDVKTGKVVEKFGQPEEGVNAMALSADGSFLALALRSNRIMLYDFKTRKQIVTLSGHKAPINSLAFAGSGYLISGSSDATAIIWDLNTFSTHRVLAGHGSNVSCVAVSKDRNFVITASDDRLIRIWDIHSGYLIETLSGHTDEVNSVAFSHDGQYALSCGDDETIRIWDINEARQVGKLKGHYHWITTGLFLSGDKYIVTGSWDKTVIRWGVDSVVKPLDAPVVIALADTAVTLADSTPEKQASLRDTLQLTEGQSITLSHVQFELGTDKLLPSSYLELSKWFAFLKDNPTVKIRIEGHTDIKGDQAANQQLSVMRAERVMRYFTDNGIDVTRISAVGMGSSRPICRELTEDCGKRNRRVEIVILSR